MIKEIVEAVTIPVMAKVRIGHFVEAQVGHPLTYNRHICSTLAVDSSVDRYRLHRRIGGSDACG